MRLLMQCPAGDGTRLRLIVSLLLNWFCGNGSAHFQYFLLSRSEEHTSELQSLRHLVCRLLLEKTKCILPHPSGDIARKDLGSGTGDVRARHRIASKLATSHLSRDRYLTNYALSSTTPLTLGAA